MQNVSEAWKEAQRQIVAPLSQVEIEYNIIDPDNIGNVTATANSEASFSDVAAIVDGTPTEYSAYSTLERNLWVLDGTRKLLSASSTENYGYVSDVISSENMTYDTHPLISLSLQTAATNSIPGITIQWSETLDECANTYTITAYNGQSVVASRTVTNNTENAVFTAMPISGYDRITIEIIEWCLPFRRARIEQIVLGLTKIFTSYDLISVKHSQRVDPLSLQLPVSQIVFDINNTDEQWNPDNPEGAYNYLANRQEIKMRYGYKINNSIQWINAGIFYMSEWDTPQNGITASFTARDILEFMDAKFIVRNGTYALTYLCQLAFEQGDIPISASGSERWIIDSALDNISATIDDSFNYSCAEVVQYCANAAQCVMYQDREGIFRIEKLDATLTDYIIDRFNSYANAEYEITRELKSVTVNDGMGEYSNSASGETVEINNPFIQSAAVANNVAQWVASILADRKKLSGDFRADPRLDALDAVTVKNKYAENKTLITSIEYSYNGAIKGTYEGRVINDN